MYICQLQKDNTEHMSENIIPEKVQQIVSDVAEKLAQTAEVVAQKAEQLSDKLEDVVEDVIDDAKESLEDLSDKSLSELSDLFDRLRAGADSMSKSKEAETIKSAFYKLMSKLKSEVTDNLVNPYESVEQNFKAMYADYKKQRADFNKQQDEQKEANLAKKQAIIEELKTLVEGQEDASSRFPEFRELQNRWKEAGQVPVKSFRDINDSYQYYVEKFYDMVKISRDLRDLDFKKNLEVKIAFCEAAEKLAENDNVVVAFRELQKLHDQWKEFGPVAKEYRDDIWNRFKAATSVINKRYQAHFEGVKDQQVENLAQKTLLCERVEEIVTIDIQSSSEWNKYSKEIEDIQAQWKKIGYATKKENQKIYDRFRAACDAFYAHKRQYYTVAKDEMSVNLEKKMALIEKAEALKSSTDWKKTTDSFISLQKEWKEIGAVPRKKSDQIWKRFRAACDEYFKNRDANQGPENDFYSNLKAKKQLIEEIRSFSPSEYEADNNDAMRDFSERWNAIGHVPYRDKDKVLARYHEAMAAKFPGFDTRPGRSSKSNGVARNPKDSLVAKYNALQQDIITYENNIGFFAASKNSAPLIKQMQTRIDEAKAELKKLEAQIRKSEEE